MSNLRKSGRRSAKSRKSSGLAAKSKSAIDNSQPQQQQRWWDVGIVTTNRERLTVALFSSKENRVQTGPAASLDLDHSCMTGMGLACVDSKLYAFGRRWNPAQDNLFFACDLNNGFINGSYEFKAAGRLQGPKPRPIVVAYKRKIFVIPTSVGASHEQLTPHDKFLCEIIYVPPSAYSLTKLVSRVLKGPYGCCLPFREKWVVVEEKLHVQFGCIKRGCAKHDLTMRGCAKHDRIKRGCGSCTNLACDRVRLHCLDMEAEKWHLCLPEDDESEDDQTSPSAAESNPPEKNGTSPSDAGSSPPEKHQTNLSAAESNPPEKNGTILKSTAISNVTNTDAKMPLFQTNCCFGIELRVRVLLPEHSDPARAIRFKKYPLKSLDCFLNEHELKRNIFGSGVVPLDCAANTFCLCMWYFRSSNSILVIKFVLENRQGEEQQLQSSASGDEDDKAVAGSSKGDETDDIYKVTVSSSFAYDGCFPRGHGLKLIFSPVGHSWYPPY